jgi:hypothetical protein
MSGNRRRSGFTMNGYLTAPLRKRLTGEISAVLNTIRIPDVTGPEKPSLRNTTSTEALAPAGSSSFGKRTVTQPHPGITLLILTDLFK